MSSSLLRECEKVRLAEFELFCDFVRDADGQSQSGSVLGPLLVLGIIVVGSEAQSGESRVELLFLVQVDDCCD